MKTWEKLRKRQDFVRISQKGHVGFGSYLVLQWEPAPLLPQHQGTGTLRIGFTASRRVGGAVQRNRAKRRLRELARLWIERTQDLPCALLPASSFGGSFVFVAKASVISVPFGALCRDFSKILSFFTASYPSSIHRISSS